VLLAVFPTLKMLTLKELFELLNDKLGYQFGQAVLALKLQQLGAASLVLVNKIFGLLLHTCSR